MTQPKTPEHCGRPMWVVKDRSNDNKPIFYCPDCGLKAAAPENFGQEKPA